MNLRHDPAGFPALSSPEGFPSASELAALRAWYQGLDTRDAVGRYLDAAVLAGSSSRAAIRSIRDRLAQYARSHSRSDLAQLIGHKESERIKMARPVFQAIETLRSGPRPLPQMCDPLERWLAAQPAQALRAHGLRTLADLAVRIGRRKMWWSKIPGIGITGARRIEAFLAGILNWAIMQMRCFRLPRVRAWSPGNCSCRRGM